MTFICVLCKTVFDFHRALPQICPNPKCAKTAHWRSLEDDEPPVVEYQLTRNDQQFLHSVKIDPEA